MFSNARKCNFITDNNCELSTYCPQHIVQLNQNFHTKYKCENIYLNFLNKIWMLHGICTWDIYTIINAEMWTQILDKLVHKNASGKDKQV